MKHVIALSMVMLLVAAVALAASDKLPDTEDNTIQSPSRIQIAGVITEASPVWDRGYGFGDPSYDCMFELTPAYYQGQYYDMFCFNVSDQMPVEFEVVLDGTLLHDTTMHIFCDPFDAMMPLVNCLYYDDDGGEGLLSAITAEDGVVLAPGVDYWLVISNYGVGDPDDMGAFVINTSDNVALCGTVPLQDTDWSSVKGLFR